MALLGRSRLGVYEIVEPLGGGGMGTVYRARHTLLKQDVALKVLPSFRLADPQAIARFRREMEAAGRLDHPNIVAARDAGEADGAHFLVMELVDGRDLSQLVKERGPLPVSEACAIVRQAAEALDYAHAQGLVHRDIKPSNLMLTTDGRVKLLDLGLARWRSDQGGAAELTEIGQVMGTVDYMAPEQALDPATADIRSDLYGLGCTLYFLLTGRAPFSGPKYGDILKKVAAHAQEPVPSICRVRPDVPEALAAILDRLLAKKPADRYATPAELIAALSGLTHVAESQPATPHGPPFVRRGVDPLPMERRQTSAFGRRIALAASLSLLLAAPGAWWFLSGPRSPSKHDDRASEASPLGPSPLVTAPAGLANRPSWALETALPRGLLARAVAFRPDGRRFATYGLDGTIRVRETDTGRLVKALVGARGVHPNELRRPLAWSPDGRFLATCDPSAETIFVWEVEPGALRQALCANAGGPVVVAWSPDGQTLAASYESAKPSLRFWDPASGRPKDDVTRVGAPILGLAWSPDSRTLALADASGEVRLWSADSPGAPALLMKFETPLTPAFGRSSLAWSPDGKRLLAGCTSGEAKLWSTATRQLQTFRGVRHAPGGAVFCFADGTLSLGSDLWSVESGKPLRALVPESDATEPVAWSADGRFWASGADFRPIAIRSADSGKALHEFRPHPLAAGWCAWSPDGKRIATACDDHSVRLWDATTGEYLRALPSPEGVARVGAWSPDGSKLALGNCWLSIFDAATGRRTDENLSTGAEWGPWLAWSPDGKALAAIADHALKVLEPGSRKPARVLIDQVPHQPGGAAWSPDGKALAVAGPEVVRLVDVVTGAVLRVLEKASGPVAWSPDGKGLACAGGVFDVDTGRLLDGPFEPALLPTDNLAWSGDSKTLTALHNWGGDVTVTEWDAALRKQARSWSVPPPIGTVSLAPDLRRALSITGSRAWVWELATGRSLGVLVPFSEEGGAAISPEGHVRGTSRALREFVYVVRSGDGQEPLTAEEFAARYGWKNDPARVRMDVKEGLSR